MPPVAAPQFEGGRASPGLIAEHGFSALVTTRRGNRTHTVLFDTGISPDGMATNFERMELDASAIEAVVLSHGHPDHDGGFPGLARLRGRSGLPLAVHPLVFSRRRFALPNAPAMELPTLSRSALEAEGFEVIERRQPSLLLDGSVLITGEVDRTTEFEQRNAQSRGVARRALGARPADPRRAGAGGARPREGTGRPYRLRPRRRGKHRAACPAADGSGSPACAARRVPPHRQGLRADHRTDRQRVP